MPKVELLIKACDNNGQTLPEWKEYLQSNLIPTAQAFPYDINDLDVANATMDKLITVVDDFYDNIDSKTEEEIVTFMTVIRARKDLEVDVGRKAFVAKMEEIKNLDAGEQQKIDNIKTVFLSDETITEKDVIIANYIIDINAGDYAFAVKVKIHEGRIKDYHNIITIEAVKSDEVKTQELLAEDKAGCNKKYDICEVRAAGSNHATSGGECLEAFLIVEMEGVLADLKYLSNSEKDGEGNTITCRRYSYNFDEKLGAAKMAEIRASDWLIPTINFEDIVDKVA